MSDIRYIISVDDKGAIKSIKDFSGALDESKRAAGETESKFGGLWKQFAIGTLAVDALKKGFGYLKDFIGSSITAAMDAETTQNNLKAALESTGRTVEPLAQHFNDMATAIMKETTVSDEAVRAAQTLLVQLTNLNSSGIDRATKGAVGLASVLGIDLQSAVMLVTKAAEGNTAALGRYGIKIDETLKPQEKFNALMEKLDPFYQRAIAQSGTFAGSLAQLKNWWDELKESVGKAITENEGIRDTIQRVKETIVDLIESGKLEEWVNAASGAFTAFADTLTNIVIPIFETSFPKVIELIDERIKNMIVGLFSLQFALIKLKSPFKDTSEEMHNLMTEFGNFIGALKYHDVKLEDFGKTINETGNAIDTMLKKITPKPLEDLRFAFRTLLIDTKDFTDNATKDWIDYMNMIGGKSKETFDGMIDEVPKYENKVKETMGQVKNYFTELYNDIATGWANTIQKWIEGGTKFRDFIKEIWEDVKSSFFRVIGEMIAKWTIDFIKELIEGAKKGAEGIVDTLGNAASSVGKTISGLGTGIKELMISMAEGIAGAAKIIAAGAKEILIAAGVVAAIYFGFKLLGSLFGGGGGGKQGDVTFWLKLITDNTQILVNYISTDFLGYMKTLVEGIFPKFDDLKASVDLTRDSMRPMLEDLLGQIRDYTYGTWDAIKNISKFQGGYEGIVSRPTLFVAGERGPERVTIMPSQQNFNISSGMIHVILKTHGRVLAETIAPYMPEITKDGRMKIHTNSLVSH